MKEIRENCYKGTRILLGNEKRTMIDYMISLLKEMGYMEISIPIIQLQQIFQGKVGAENNNLMFNFTDRGNREICLAPEYTAVIQKLIPKTWKHEKDLKLFYVQECFRGENPQAGRFRQFTQLGVEIINPTEKYDLSKVALKLINNQKVSLNTQVKRGLDYYKDGEGFEIVLDSLGSSKQICGGGEYEGGVGFAIGIDRLIYNNGRNNLDT